MSDDTRLSPAQERMVEGYLRHTACEFFTQDVDTAVATAPMPPITPVGPMRNRRLRASTAGEEAWPVTACVAASVKSVAMECL